MYKNRISSLLMCQVSFIKNGLITDRKYEHFMEREEVRDYE